MLRNVAMAFLRAQSIFFLAALLCSGADSAHASSQYELGGLRGEKSTKYPVPARSATREYFLFVNEAGNHRFIYEESPGAESLPGIAGLRNVMGNKELVCKIELVCKKAAFCTGGCKNMYYESSNTPLDPTLQGRNHCTISTFKCDKASGSGVAIAR